MLCTVNPAVGMEQTMAEDLIVPAGVKLKIVVVGGGPAGMEAARLAALSGHHVVVFEAQPRLGGAINIARRAPKLASIGDITQWLEQELAILGVDVRLSCYVEAEDVLAERPDAVIIATGSLPRMDGVQVSRPEHAVPGFDLPHVVSSHDVLFMPREKLGSAALVFDDVGHYEAIACAEYLIGQGVKVTFVTRHSSFAPHIEAMVRTGPALRRLRKGDFTLVTGGRLVSIAKDSSEIGYLDGDQTWRVPAETVVLVTYNDAQNSLYRDLGGGGKRPDFALHLVGDANAPRDLLMAMREGHLAGRNIQ
jgi:thioredoxin reductase